MPKRIRSFCWRRLCGIEERTIERPAYFPPAPDRSGLTILPAVSVAPTALDRITRSFRRNVMLHLQTRLVGRRSTKGMADRSTTRKDPQ
jgi:hypothetical protein